jgi:hypothetical protein
VYDAKAAVVLLEWGTLVVSEGKVFEILSLVLPNKPTALSHLPQSNSETYELAVAVLRVDKPQLRFAVPSRGESSSISQAGTWPKYP